MWSAHYTPLQTWMPVCFFFVSEIAIFVLELSREAHIRPSTIKTVALVLKLAILAQSHPPSDVAHKGTLPRQHDRF
jgi:hypothetical protein